METIESKRLVMTWESRLPFCQNLQHESPWQTLDATALVHEAWLCLADASIEWNDKTHFLRTAAMAMLRIHVDRARAKLAAKRDGGARVELTDFPAPLPDDELLALDSALEKLTLTKPDHSKLLELSYFAGLTGDAAAAALGVSPATTDRMGSLCEGVASGGTRVESLTALASGDLSQSI